VGLAKSSSEGRRLVQQGGVKIDGEKVGDLETKLERDGELLIQVGKRRFLRLRFV
jgi:tyrosyl-tRNA synthetase